jgi:hypothetical protein
MEVPRFWGYKVRKMLDLNGVQGGVERSSADWILK